MKQKIIIGASFAVLVLVTILPALIYGYVYPNMSDDTANHLSVILRMVNGTLPDFEFRYLGYAIIGYPLYWISEITNISMVSLFNWFHILIPIVIGGVLYFVFSRLINWVAGLFALIIPVYISSASVYYMYFGIIFNLISVTILYPLLFYFTVKWIVEHRVWQLIGVIIFTFLVSTFHVNGIYLPVVAVFVMVVYLIYAKIMKRKICRRKVFLGLIIMCIGIIFIIAIPYTRQQIIDVINGMLGNTILQNSRAIELNAVYKSIVPIDYFVSNFLSFFVVGLFVIAMIKFHTIKENFSSQSKLFLFIVCCWGIVLLIIAYGKFSTIPFRQQIDFAIVFSILTTILLGVASFKGKQLVLVITVILVGLYPQFIPTWFHNNSAVKEVDKQTIEYLNTLDIESYDCSPTVSYVVYNLFTNAKYGNNADILIVRNEPMTQGSDVKNVYYDGHGRTNIDGYVLDKIFEDGVVRICVYRR